MKERFKPILKYTGVFLLGVIVGAVLLETLENYLRPAYRDLIIRSHLKTEQEFLASRATRENRKIDAAFHRWVVVNAESDTGFRVFRVPNSKLDDNQYLYPLAMLWLKSMALDENYVKGKRIVEGYDRGKLAVALEIVGQKNEAESQWRLAQALMNRKTIQETKTTVRSMLKLEKSDLHLQAEKKVLEK